MGSETVLMINVSPDETLQIEELLSESEFEEGVLRPISVPSVEEAERLLSRDRIRLVILHVDGQRQRPDQDIRRIKRSSPRPVPLLLLVVQDLKHKVKDYLRAGADEYWILPLDAHAFPPRLSVLLEWGEAIVAEDAVPLKKGRSVSSESRSVFRRIIGWLHRLLSRSQLTRPFPTVETIPEIIATKWRKMRRLGFGSFGEVWLVEEQETKELAVAKIPHDPKLNKKFLREAAILKQLIGHPNAVQLKEVVKEDEKVILIQEYVDGLTLQDLLAQEMGSAAKEKAFLELLEVVAAAHTHNVMHRDIKPENIIINHSGHLKLLDFGTGKDLTRRSISSTVIGSRPYMAPEQIMGKSRLASDVWALGVILYALSTECLPFYDENEKTLMDLILEVEPERPRNLEPDLPEDLEAIILRCLQKDWSKRYPNAVELKNDLMERLPNFGRGEVLPQP